MTSNEMINIESPANKRIALVAHDNMKREMLERGDFHQVTPPDALAEWEYRDDRGMRVLYFAGTLLVEAADAKPLGVLAHQERAVEGGLRAHERLQHVAEALRRQRGLALADFQLGRRPDLFLLSHAFRWRGGFPQPIR